MPVMRAIARLYKNYVGNIAQIVAHGVMMRPETPPTYPLIVASHAGTPGRYEILLAGDGDPTAYVAIYVDCRPGTCEPTEFVESNIPAKIEGEFSNAVHIQIEGEGHHSTLTYAVFALTTVLADVDIGYRG